MTKSPRPGSLSTDSDWETWGRLDPYFGVITQSRFRRQRMTDRDRQEFFESGRVHVQFVLHTIRRHIDPSFEPKAILDFGCGVGRMLIPFAEIGRETVGLDVSPSMLDEARRNCDAHKLSNVRLLLSDSSVSALSGAFDLIHSFIVFQHLLPDQARDFVSRLITFLAPGGVGCLHFLYSKIQYAATHGSAPTATKPLDSDGHAKTPGADPVIQMHPCNVNQILFVLQTHQVRRFHTEFTDHGGELGLFIFFQVT